MTSLGARERKLRLLTFIFSSVPEHCIEVLESEPIMWFSRHEDIIITVHHIMSCSIRDTVFHRLIIVVYVVLHVWISSAKDRTDKPKF